MLDGGAVDSSTGVSSAPVPSAGGWSQLWGISMGGTAPRAGAWMSERPAGSRQAVGRVLDDLWTVDQDEMPPAPVPAMIGASRACAARP